MTWIHGALSVRSGSCKRSDEFARLRNIQTLGKREQFSLQNSDCFFGSHKERFHRDANKYRVDCSPFCRSSSSRTARRSARFSVNAIDIK
jgi:hypothetical protein